MASAYEVVGRHLIGVSRKSVQADRAKYCQGKRLEPKQLAMAEQNN
jgi:hypothetical protein